MKVFILQDEKGELWKEMCVVATPTKDSDTYTARKARTAIYHRFANYWVSGRFPLIDNDFAEAFAKLCEKHGWKIREFDAVDIETRGPIQEELDIPAFLRKQAPA